MFLPVRVVASIGRRFRLAFLSVRAVAGRRQRICFQSLSVRAVASGGAARIASLRPGWLRLASLKTVPFGPKTAKGSQFFCGPSQSSARTGLSKSPENFLSVPFVPTKGTQKLSFFRKLLFWALFSAKPLFCTFCTDKRYPNALRQMPRPAPCVLTLAPGTTREFASKPSPSLALLVPRP